VRIPWSIDCSRPSCRRVPTPHTLCSRVRVPLMRSPVWQALHAERGAPWALVRARLRKMARNWTVTVAKARSLRIFRPFP